jgi:hypothetical protein
MITYNLEENSKRRQSVKDMSVDEVNRAVKFINMLLEISPYVEGEEVFIQKLIDHFENLDHYRHYTQGLWVVEEKFLDKISDEHIFQLEF